MAGPISFQKTVQKTCRRIFWQFLLAIALLYLLPLMLVGFEETGKMAILGNVFAWIYISLALLGIISYHIARLFRQIKTELDLVYHKSLWTAAQPEIPSLSLLELSETSTHIGRMQRKIEAMLAREKRQKEELIFQISALSHDIKSPLTVIQGNADLLRLGALSPVQAEQVQDILEAGERLNAYSNALISYAQSYADTEQGWETCQSGDLAADLEKEATLFLKAKAAFSFVNQWQEEGSIWVQRSLVLRALGNLLHNALSHSRAAQPRLKLRLYQTEQGHCIELWNSDSRFSKESLAHFAELFYQEKQERSHKDGHYGIGLAFVQRVAQLHGGCLLAENVEDGVALRLCLGKRE